MDLRSKGLIVGSKFFGALLGDTLSTFKKTVTVLSNLDKMKISSRLAKFSF